MHDNEITIKVKLLNGPIAVLSGFNIYAEEVSIKLYDVCSRLVHREDVVRSRIGVNESLITPKNLSVGVYFVRLETEGDEKIAKAVSIR